MTSAIPSSPSGIIYVIRMDDSEQAYTAALAAIRGGVDAVELTLSVPDALQVIERLAVEDVTLGAGTVLTPGQATAAVTAGARFIVSPNTNPTVIDAAHAAGVPMIPGALTPTEVQAAHTLGADAVKLFPIGSVGGVAYLRELLGPLPDIPYVISGGAGLANAAEYLAIGARAVCIGRQLVSASDVADHDLDGLTGRVKEFLAAMRG